MEQDTPESRGFVFAVTGEKYTTLARRAARSLRLLHPEAEIDLFTDLDIEDPVFSRIHRLSESWFRPKMEALLNSRFDRTIYLDADIMVIAPLDPVFDVLDRFDVAGCHERLLNTEFVLEDHSRPLPHAFPTINGGVLAIRRRPETLRLIQEWRDTVKTSGAVKDQPALRELLYDSDLRLCVLPPHYNFMTFHELETWWGMFGAPRILHSPKLRKRREGAGDPMTPLTITEMTGVLNAQRLRAILHADRELNPDAEDAARNLYGALEPAPLRRLRIWAKPIYRRLRYRY